MNPWDKIYGGSSVPSVSASQSSGSNPFRAAAFSASVPQEEAPNYYGQRGFFGDVLSNLSRGVVSGVGIGGYALDQAGIETNLEEWANEANQRYTLLKPDLDEYNEQDSWLYSGFKGALQNAPASLLPVAIGIGAGTAVAPGFGTAAGAIAGAGAGLATLVGYFGMGTYNQTYREAIDKGVDPAQAKSLALETAAWEVGTEGLSDVAAVATGGLFGSAAKILGKGASNTLASILKVSPGQFAKQVGATMSAEVGSEALNAYMQTTAQIKAGLDPGMSPSDAALASIGPSMWLSGAMSVGLGGMQVARKKEFAKALASDKTPQEDRMKMANVVFEEINKKDPTLAANWMVVAEEAIKVRQAPLNINADFVAQADKLLKGQAAAAAKAPLDEVKEMRSAASAEVQTALGTSVGPEVVGAEEIEVNHLHDMFREEFAKRGIDLSSAQESAQVFMDRGLTNAELAANEQNKIADMEAEPGYSEKKAELEAVFNPPPPPPLSFEERRDRLIQSRTPASKRDRYSGRGQGAFTWQQANSLIPEQAAPEVPKTERDKFSERKARIEAEAQVKAKEEEPRKKRELLSLDDTTIKMLKPELLQAITETPLAELEQMDSATRWDYLGRRASGENAAEQENATTEQPAVPARKLSQDDRKNLYSAITEYNSLLNQDQADATSMDTATTGGLSASDRVRLKEIQKEVDLYVGKTDEDLSVDFPDVVDIASNQTMAQAKAAKRAEVDEAEIDQRIAATMEQVRSTTGKAPEAVEAEAGLVEAIHAGDLKRVEQLTKKYDFLSRRAAVVEAAIKVRDSLEGLPDNESTRRIKLNAQQALATQMPTRVQEAMAAAEAEAGRPVKENERAANPDIKEGYLNWQRKGPTLHVARDPISNNIYFLFRESAAGANTASGRWNIFTAEETGDKMGGIRIREVDVFEPSGNGQNVNAYVQRFYKKGGVKGVKALSFNDLDNANAFQGTKKYTNYYVTLDGKYAVVPKSNNGRWGVLPMETFEDYKNSSIKERQGITLLGTNSVNGTLDEALKTAKALVGEARAAEEAAPKKEKLTATSEFLQQYQEDNAGLKAAEQFGTRDWELAKQEAENPPGPVVKPKVSAKEKKAIIERVAAKAETDTQERTMNLLWIRDQIDNAFAKGNLRRVKTLRAQMISQFRQKGVKLKDRKKIIANVDQFLKATMAKQYADVADDISAAEETLGHLRDARQGEVLLKHSTKSLDKQIAEVAGRIKDLGMRKTMLIEYAMEISGAPSIKSTEALLQSHSKDFEMDILKPPVTKAPEKSQAQQKRDAIQQKTENAKKAETLAVVEGRTEEGFAGKKMPTQKKGKLLQRRGSLSLHEGEHFWRADSGHTVWNEVGKFVVYDRAGRPTGQQYRNILMAARDEMFKAPAPVEKVRKIQQIEKVEEKTVAKPPVRTVETVAQTEEEKAAAAIWKEVQARKKVGNKIPAEQEILDTPLINGWKKVEKVGDRLTLTSQSGELVAYWKVSEVETLLGTKKVQSWSISSKVDGQTQFLGKVETLEQLMLTVSGKTSRSKTVSVTERAKQQLAGTVFSSNLGSQELTGNTVPAVLRAIRRLLGEKGVQRWGDQVHAVQSIDETEAVGMEIRSRGIKGQVVGYFNPSTGSITLIADFIVKGQEADIFTHEALHYVMEFDSFYKKNKALLLKDFDKLRAKSEAVQAAYDKAVAENPDLELGSAELLEEAYAYFMQKSANRETSIWRKGIALVRRWLIQAGFSAGRWGMTEKDFAALASHSIRTVEPVKISEALLHQSFFKNMESKEPSKEIMRKLKGTVMLHANGKPLLFYAGTIPIDDTLSLYGHRLSPEGTAVGRESATESRGSLAGYHVNMKNPLFRSKQQLEAGIFGKEEAQARVRRYVELDGHDGIIVTERAPRFDEKGKLIKESIGMISDVIAFDPGQIVDAETTFTAADVQGIRFASTGGTNVQTTRANKPLPVDGRRRFFRPPVTAETPEDSKGRPKSDTLLYDGKTGLYTHHKNYDPTIKGYRSINVLSEAEALAVRKEYAEVRAEKMEDFLQETDTISEIGGKLSDTAGKGRQLASNLLKSISEGVREISEHVYTRLNRYEFDIHQREKKYNKAASGFIKTYQSLPDLDKLQLDQALRNGDTDVRDLVLSRNGITSEFEKVQSLLDEVLDEAAEYGLIPRAIYDFFPRVVKPSKLDQLVLALERGANQKEAMAALNKERANLSEEEYQAQKEAIESAEPEDFTIVGEELRKAEVAAKKKGKTFVAADKVALISRLVGTNAYQFIAKPGSSKLRAYEKVLPQYAEFYETSAESLKHYLYEMAEAIETRRFLGKKEFSRAQLMNKQRAKVKAIARFEKLMDAKPLTKKQQKAYNDVIEQEAVIRAQLNDVDLELEESIGQYIKDEMDAGNIKDDPASGKSNSHELMKLLKARLTQRGTSGIVGTFRDVAYAFALGSPLSAITQIGDLAFSAYANGPLNTAAAIIRSLPAIFQSDTAVVKEYFDFSHAMTDFSTNASAHVLDKVLTYSGLKGMDLFGKEVFFQAALRKARKSNKAVFARELAPLMDGDISRAEQVWEKIQSGNIEDRDVLFTLFNGLSQWQPIALSEMPAAYNQAGNMRVFYMLKTFNIKALNSLRRELITDYKAGSKVKGAVKFVYLATLLSLAGAGSDEIKDWILGKEKDFSDHAMDNLVQLTLLNRYALEKGLSSGRLLSAIGEGFLPPMRFAEYAIDDMAKFMFDRENFKAKSIQNIPGVGRIIYSRTEAGQKSELDKRKEDLYARIRKGAASGGTLYNNDIRRLLDNYNELASEEGKEVLKYKQLKNVRKKELKKLREAEAS